jgi:cytochrome c biogenesis protein CcmG/thiol:disulfide interchange protein DsbE
MNTKFADKGVKIIAVDVSNRKDLTQKLMAGLPYTAPTLLDADGISRKQYNVVATPTTYLIDPSGRMIFKHVGYGPGMEKVLEKEIELLLARKTA